MIFWWGENSSTDRQLIARQLIDSLPEASLACQEALKVVKEKARPSGGHASLCAGTIQGKEGRMQVLAGIAPSSQTIGSNKRVIHVQAKRSSWTTEANSTLTLAAKLGEGGKELVWWQPSSKAGWLMNCRPLSMSCRGRWVVCWWVVGWWVVGRWVFTPPIFQFHLFKSFFIDIRWHHLITLTQTKASLTF